MKTLFIADPLAKIKPQSDSTLVLVRQALTLRHEVYWATDSQIEFEKGRVFVNVERIDSANALELPLLSSSERVEISQFKLVFIRKDPPFNASYVRLCWILALAENKTTFINLPSRLLRYHEKLVPLEALATGYLAPKDVIPTHVGSFESAKPFVQTLNCDEVILKPFLGFGGNDIQRIRSEDFLKGLHPHVDLIVQPFMKAVEEGDHRVFFLNGKIIGSFARIPKAGHFVSNLAAGGSAKAVSLTKSQTKVMEKVGGFLKSRNIFFAGGDLIGNLVSEVNITSPTGLIAHERLYGEDLSVKIIKEAVKCL